jgi:predicted PurR-regulated permease PerM
MEGAYFKKVTALILVLILLVLSFLILRPILLSIVFGFILAFIFYPIYQLLYKATKWPNFSATILTLLLILIILLPIWFFTPIFIDQAFKIYTSSQHLDYVTPLKTIFPSLFASEQFSAEVGGVLHSFVTKIANSLLNYLSEFILNFPTLLLQSAVVLFAFFFALRDKDKILEYVKSLLPFTREVEEKIFRSSRDITASVLYGQVIVGIVQGIIIAIGFFLFGVPNAFLFSVLATVAAILPVIGPMLVWIPVLLYLLITGNAFAAIGILIFGLISSNIDSILRPLFISKMTRISSAIILIGMIGGLFMFGVLGLILGPLILAYLLIILEVLRNPKSSKSLSSLLKKTR